MQHFLVAAAVEGEYRSEAVGSAEPCGAVNGSRRIERDAAEGTSAVRDIAKSVEDRLQSSSAQFEYGSAAAAIASFASIAGGAVEISGRVCHQARVRVRTIGTTDKTV